jgi:hypothetical protein
MEITISNHPLDASIERKVQPEFHFCNSDQNGQKVVLTCHVLHYKNGEYYSLIPNKELVFVADNTTLVAATTGIPIDGEPEEGQEVIGEYDFMLQLLNSAIVVADVITAKIEYLVQQGRI